jgi:hypothetical protein
MTAQLYWMLEAFHTMLSGAGDHGRITRAGTELNSRVTAPNTAQIFLPPVT